MNGVVEEMVCTYPLCGAKALYKSMRDDGKVAYLCRDHYFELKALGMASKTFRLEIPKKDGQ